MPQPLPPSPPGRGVACGLPELLALMLAAVAPAMVALNTPTLIPPDGLDYLDGAAQLLENGTLAGVVPYKAPGLTFLAATILWLDPSLGLLVWIHGIVILCTAIGAWTALRLLGSRWMALAAGLLVAWHPSILTYQPYLLREAVAPFFATCIAIVIFMLFRRAATARQHARTLGLSAALGLVIGLGALYRENFLAFVPMGIVAAALASLAVGEASRRPALRATHALAAGGVVWLVAMIALLPWLTYNHSRLGLFVLTTPKTQFNRCINAWANGLIDDGSTRPRAVHDYAFVASILAQHGAAAPELVAQSSVDAVIEAMLRDPRTLERLCKAEVNGAIAARPGKAAHDMGWSLVSQLGAWDVSWHPNARGNLWHSEPLRAARPGMASNYTFDVDGVMSNSRFTPHQARWQPLLAATRTPPESHASGRFARAFDAWFHASELARPALAAAFLLGTVLTIVRRRWGVLAIACIVLANVLGAAWMMTPLDRFSVPLLPLMLIVAASAIVRVPRGSQHATITPPPQPAA